MLTSPTAARTVPLREVQYERCSFDIERCACGGKLKLVAVIEEPAVIEKILTHLGLAAQPPPRTPARRRADLLEWA